MVNTHRRISSGIMRLEDWCRVVGRIGVVWYEARGACVEGHDAVAEERVGAETDCGAGDDAEDAFGDGDFADCGWGADCVHCGGWWEGEEKEERSMGRWAFEGEDWEVESPRQMAWLLTARELETSGGGGEVWSLGVRVSELDFLSPRLRVDGLGKPVV